mgnify:CR=1 FL=1
MTRRSCGVRHLEGITDRQRGADQDRETRIGTGGPGDQQDEHLVLPDPPPDGDPRAMS